MKKILFIILFFIHLGFPQQEPELLPKLKHAFGAFEYERTIIYADSILQSKDSLAAADLIEVLNMQAIAYFSLDNLIKAENTFIHLLEIMPSFSLNESETSPKIIAFYDKIKLEYLSEQFDQNEEEKDSELDQIVKMKKALESYKTGMLRSLVLPGWGHYYIDENEKGLILNLGSLITLAPGIYYGILTARYEKAYLNTAHEGQIESRYHRYNNAYKNRNIFLSAFALIWLYSQYDYFFTDHEGFNSNQQIILGFNPASPSPRLQLVMQF